MILLLAKIKKILYNIYVRLGKTPVRSNRLRRGLALQYNLKVLQPANRLDDRNTVEGDFGKGTLGKNLFLPTARASSWQYLHDLDNLDAVCRL